MLITLIVEKKWLCIEFFPYSQLGKSGFANLYYKGFSIIFRIEFLQLLALNKAQPTYEAQDPSVVWVLRSSNSTKHHGKRFSNHTLLFIYQKLKMNERVNQDKQHTRHKI
jgi:hypothetical protein